MSIRDEYDVSRMKWDPLCAGMMASAYPELTQFPEFTIIPEDSPITSDGSLDELTRYAMLSCCRESPLAKIKEPRKKLEIAITLAGCGEESRTEILAAGSTCRAMMLRVFSLDCGHELEEYWAMTLLFGSVMNYMTVSIDDGGDLVKQMAARKGLSELKKDISELEEKLFKDKNLASHYVLQRSAEELKGFAEKQARNYTSGAIF